MARLGFLARLHHAFGRRRDGAVSSSLASLLRQFDEAAIANGGGGFFDALVTHLAARLDVSYAFAAVVDDSQPGQLTVLAACGDGIMAANLMFRVAGTPCECVLQLGPRSYPTRIPESFPEDLLLQSMGVESFVGTWLRDSAGQPCGVLAVMDRAPMPHPHLAEALLDALGPRAAAEVGRLRAEAALRSAETKLARVYAACTDAITISSLTEGRYLDVSEGFSRLFGHDRRAAIGRTAADLGIWRTPSSRHDLVVSLAEEGMVRDREAELVSRDGSVKTCLISADVIEIEGRACMLAITRDITDRKAAEAALRASEGRYRALFEESQALNFVVGRDGILLDVNDAVVRAFAVGRDQLIGRSALDFIATEDHTSVETAIAKLFAGGQPRPCEIHIRTGDQQRTLMLAMGGLDQSGDRPCMLVNALDVTEWHRATRDRVRLEEQVRQAQKMEAIGRLAGGIAHDFNNILQLIEGHLSVAIEQLPADSGAAAPLSAALKTIARGAGLTRQLLTFSGREPASICALDLAGELADLVTLMQGVIGEHISLAVTAEPHLPSVRLDRTQLEQIVLNLCMNARDAMSSGGRIGIDARPAEIAGEFCATHPAAREGAYVCLTVADSGSGIPPGVLQHIFEPFFTTKETGRGTGLGLATVYAIVQRAGGFLDVTSEVGVGTSVRVYLPNAAAHAVRRPALRSNAAGGESADTILVVEAEQAVRTLVATCLEREGYRVIAAGDGEEALSHLEAHRDDVALAVLDAVVPKAGGAALFHLVRRMLPDVPVIFTSGYNHHPLVADPVMADRYPVLFKPYVPAELLKLVGRLLEGGSRASRRGSSRLVDDPRR